MGNTESSSGEISVGAFLSLLLQMTRPLIVACADVTALVLVARPVGSLAVPTAVIHADPARFASAAAEHPNRRDLNRVAVHALLPNELEWRQNTHMDTAVGQHKCTDDRNVVAVAVVDVKDD